MVGKESREVMKREPWYWNIWGLEPQDVTKDDAVFAESASCVAVKREGKGERGVEEAAALLAVSNWMRVEVLMSCECSGRNRLGRELSLNSL